MELDDIIDSALKSYVAQEPRGGLEERVLYRIRLERQPASHFPRWLALVVPVLACAVFAFVNMDHKSEKRLVPALREQVWMRVPLPAATPVVVRHARRVEPALRQPVFPSVSPLTAGERALMTFATTAPEGVVSAFIDWHETVPIAIDEIQIAPLPGSGEQ